MNKIYKNKLQLPQLTKNQLEVLKMQLIKLNLHNKLLLTINKRIHNYPHTKINNKMGSSLNQSITYNFSKNNGTNSNLNFKNINLSKENIFKYTSINNSARIGVINFVIKIISSFFNSLYCIIAKPQFINKHDKLIIRIPYYQNNVQKDLLFSNTNSNHVFNILTNNLSNNNNKVIINNMLKNNNSINITKNSIIKWLKDYLNLNTDNLNNKIIDLNTIDNYIKNDKIIDNKSLNSNNFYNLKGKLNRKTNLLMKIANTNKLDYLNTKRLSNLKITSNKLLMLKIIKNLNYNNDKSTEILGKGTISHPVSINTLNKLFGGVYDSKGYLGDLNFVNEYKLISTKLLAINFFNNKTNIENAYSKEIDSLNKLSKNKLMINLKLINRINQNLFNLKSQFTENKNNSINFILNNIIKQFNPNILFYNNLLNNNNNNSTFNLILLNRQLSLINKLGLNLLNFNKINNTSISELNNNNYTSNIDYAKLNLNIKIIKLIIKNNIILTNTFNNYSNYSNYSNITKPKPNKNYNLDELNILNNKIKEALLSFEFYNNKAHNNSNILKNNIIKFKWLGILLSKIFNKNISIELIRLWNIGLEPTILSNIISKNSITDKSSIIFKKLWKKISINKANNLRANIQNSIINGNNFVYNKSNLLNNQKANLNFNQVNDFIKDSTILNTKAITLAKPVGISIKIAGRLATERIAPKRTTKSILVGSIEKGRGNVIDSYKFTSKNKRGAFTISVRISSARTYSTSSRLLQSETNTNLFNSNPIYFENKHIINNKLNSKIQLIINIFFKSRI